MNIYLTLALIAWFTGPAIVLFLFLFHALYYKEYDVQDIRVVILAFFYGPVTFYVMWKAWKDFNKKPKNQF